MSAFQVLATVGTVLGLLLTAALAITGWIIAGVKDSLKALRRENEDLRKELERVHLKMVEEYVKDHDLKGILERLDKTLDKVATNIENTGKDVQALSLAMAKIEGASTAAAATIAQGGVKREG